MGALASGSEARSPGSRCTAVAALWASCDTGGRARCRGWGGVRRSRALGGSHGEPWRPAKCRAGRARRQRSTVRIPAPSGGWGSAQAPPERARASRRAMWPPKSPRPPDAAPASPRAGLAVRILCLRVAILIAGLAVWEIGARAANPLLYVPPSVVVPALGRLLTLDSYPDLPSSLLLTLREIVIAYGLAIAAGVGVGAVLGLNRFVGRAYGPIVAALYAVPAVVWYPSLMLFFGLDAASKIAFGFLLGFFPITLAVLAGIRQVNPHMIAVARAFGARPTVIFAKVMVPAMMFTLVGGLRTGLALTVIGVIVGEVLGSKAGMGALISHAYGLLRTADYVALVCVTLVLIVGCDAVAS